MKTSKLRMLIFMALCCDLGLVTKKIINPFANVITDALHIPGGISTGFSIMFLVIAAEVVQMPGCGTLMGVVQGLLALAMGRVGSMGALTPVGYILPGIMIDMVFLLQKYTGWSRTERMAVANAMAAVMASMTANMLVFQLNGPALFLYLGVSATSGTLYGFLGAAVVKRLDPAIRRA